MGEEKARLPLWKLALFAAIPTALALLGLNFVLGRLRPPGGPARSIYTDHPYRWTQLKAGARTDLPVAPEAAHWKGQGATYRVEIDSRGFRGSERPVEKKPEVLRIVAMGDSATFGWDVEEADAFPRVLDRRLNEGQLERRFEVWNAGVPGYGTPQGRLYLEQDVLPMKPDFLTFSYGTNDEAPCRNHWSALFRWMPVSRIFRRDADGNPLPVDAFFFREPGIEGTATYRFIADLARKVKAETGIEMDLSVFTENKDCRATPLPEYEENLCRMGLAAAGAGAEALFLAIATGDEDYASAMGAAAAACGSEMLDVRKALADALPRILSDERFSEDRIEAERRFGREFLQRAPKLYYTTDYGHPNRAGHRVIAEELALSGALGDVARRHFERIGEPEAAAWLWVLRSRLFSERGEGRRAEENAAEAVRLLPEEPKVRAAAHLAAAAHLREAGRYADAEEVAARALSAFAYPEARLEHARALEALERWRDAAEAWEAWGKEAAAPRTAAHRAERARGFDASNRGDLEAAASSWEKSLAADPADPELSAELGRAYLQMEKPREAVAALLRAVAEDPGAYVVHRALAEAAEAAGDKARALAAWRWAAGAAEEEGRRAEAEAAVRRLAPPEERYGHDQGYAYMMAVDPALEGDAPDAPARSGLVLLEDGRPLKEAHAGHDRIRRAGGGLYSHQPGSVFFSTSDNTDPNLNGRRYEFRADGKGRG